MPSTIARPSLRRLAALVVCAALGACSPATGTAPPDGDRDPSLPTPDATAASVPTSATSPRAGSGRIPAGAEPATVTGITDGDTVRVRIHGADEPVRLLEIDAPEVDGGCAADRATAFVTRRAPVGTGVWLERDVSDRDRYGRLLRYIWTDGGHLLNAAIVRAGWARAKLYEPDDGRWVQMQRAERAARRAGRGIWSLCADADPGGTPPDTGAGTRACDPNYSGCVPVYPPDVDCDRVDGPVRVTGADPHNLDGNHDGMGCEGPPS